MLIRITARDHRVQTRDRLQAGPRFPLQGRGSQDPPSSLCGVPTVPTHGEEGRWPSAGRGRGVTFTPSGAFPTRRISGEGRRKSCPPLPGSSLHGAPEGACHPADGCALLSTTQGRARPGVAVPGTPRGRSADANLLYKDMQLLLKRDLPEAYETRLLSPWFPPPAANCSGVCSGPFPNSRLLVGLGALLLQPSSARDSETALCASPASPGPDSILPFIRAPCSRLRCFPTEAEQRVRREE